MVRLQQFEVLYEHVRVVSQNREGVEKRINRGSNFLLGDGVFAVVELVHVLRRDLGPSLLVHVIN